MNKIIINVKKQCIPCIFPAKEISPFICTAFLLLYFYYIPFIGIDYCCIPVMGFPHEISSVIDVDMPMDKILRLILLHESPEARKTIMGKILRIIYPLCGSVAYEYIKASGLLDSSLKLLSPVLHCLVGILVRRPAKLVFHGTAKSQYPHASPLSGSGHIWHLSLPR